MADAITTSAVVDPMELQSLTAAPDQGALLADGVSAAQQGDAAAGLVAAAIEPLPGVIERAQSLLEIGGPVVVLLLMMSFVAVTIVVTKLIQFSWLRIGDTTQAQQALAAWRSGNAAAALACLEGRRNPVAQVVAQAVRGRESSLQETRLREELLRFGGDILFQLRRGFRPLEVIASLAPLLGLLGTVLGMIKAFQQLEAAGNQVNPAILSGGIWEALLTTAVGLCVAIPVVVMLNWLERRVDHLAHAMDNLVTQVFTTELTAPDIQADLSEGAGDSKKQATVAGIRAGAVKRA
ncbi:MAG: MotA/TolQ/ExbB proton channel family protein [Gammaproteobacteria bacterium]|nr:MotA/TolQ/ExbB proton channel family protein [Gammaproteobacteria bacterium]